MNLKKLLAVACTLALLATALVSCGKKEINPDKYVKLGEYKGITVEMDTTVTDCGNYQYMGRNESGSCSLSAVV